VPQVTRRPEKAPPSHAAPAAQQVGTVDTTTAAYAILRMESLPIGKAEFVGYMMRYLKQPAPAA